MSKKESKFQAEFIKNWRKEHPDDLIGKVDFQQGIPDVVILHNDRHALLEFKDSADAKHQPNQDYYVARENAKSFAAFIYPENEEVVRRELYSALGIER